MFSDRRRLALAAVGVTAVLGVVSFLLVEKSQTLDLAAHDRAVSALNRVLALDDQLEQHVLAARFGVLQQYDPLVAVADGLRTALDDLETELALVLPAERVPGGELDSVRQRVKERLDATESFKPRNSIFKNSLRWFPRAAREHAERRREAGDEDRARATEELLSLTLSQHATQVPALLGTAREAADRLRDDTRGLDEAETRQQVLLTRHAGRVLEEREALAPLLDELLDERVSLSVHGLRETYDHEVRTLVASDRTWRAALIGWGLLLIGLLVGLGVKLAGLYATLERKVEQRTAELDERNGDLRRVLDNVAQGFVTVDSDGRMSTERSAILERWLGSSLEAPTLWQALAAHDENAAAWLELGWEEVFADVLPRDLTIDQLPSRIHQPERTLSIGYQPIEEDGELVAIVAVLSDISSDLERERAEAEQAETAAIFQRVLDDRQGVVDFLGEARAQVTQVADCSEPSELKRVLHTLKGNCSLFGLERIAIRCHELESEMEDEGGLPSAESRQELVRLWCHLDRTLGRLVGDRSAGRIEVGRQEVDALVTALHEGTDRHELAERAASWLLEPLEVRLQRIAEQASGLAERLGKPAVSIEIEAGDLRLDRDGWQAFWSDFVHVVRNAVDHGLESAEERLAVGKSPTGTLRLRASVDAGVFCLEVADDGRGIDWEQVRSVAIERGLPAETEQQLRDALFAEGFTTRQEANAISGRGIGMNALLAATHEHGGRVVVDSAPGRGTRMVFCFPDTVLPEGARIPVESLAS
ncbi:MAG: DAHL domain-containing protein [Acidobacteriota bacterium]